MLLIEIIDDDEIEIGTRRHLTRAEPAERDNGAAFAADPAMGRGKVILHQFVNGPQEHVGKGSEYLAGLLRRYRTGQDTRADQEHVLLPELTDRIEHRFVALSIFERLPQRPFEPRPVRQGAEEARIDQRIDDVRILRQDVGKTWRDAKDQRDEADQFRILPQ